MRKLFIVLCIIFSFAVKSEAVRPVERASITKDGEIVAVRGEGRIMFFSDSSWQPTVVSQSLTSGDTLKTGSSGKLDVLFIDGVQIKVHHNTTLVIKEVAKNKKGTLLGLKSGEVWSRAKSIPDGLKIQTPSATAAIRGTDWDIVVDEKGASYLTVLNGNVELFNEYGAVKVNAGEQAMAEIGKPPVKMFLVSPKDRVQWIISYTPDFSKLISFHSYKRQDALSLLPSAKESVKSSPEDIGLKLILAGHLYDLKETDESLKLFNEILKKDPHNVKALIFKGLIHLSKGEADEAGMLFEQALKSAKATDKINASIGLAGVYLYRNDINKAENTLAQIKDEKSPVIGLALAQFQAFKGDFLNAVKICMQYASDYPNDERFYTLAADFYLTMDEPDKTNEYLQKAFVINPNASEAYALSGRYHYLSGRGKESEKSFKKAIELDPKNSRAFSEYGRLLMDEGEFEKSLNTHDKALQIEPNAHSSLSRRGMLLNWLEDIKGAQKDYNKAISINSSDYQALDGLGFIALKEGRTKDAVEYFNKASLMEPRFAEPHIFLAIAYYQQENIERALEELRLAQLLDPKDPLPHIISYLIYQDTYRPFEAIKEATQALELLPNLKSVNPVEATQKGTTNLGSALFGLGLTEWATSYAEESFNQYDAGSYFFSSIKYEGNPFIYSGTMSQGFLLNPISIRYSDRYQDIIPFPQHNFTLRATLGSEDGAFYRNNKAVQQGYIRNPWEMVYLLDWENYENKGFRRNGYERSNFITYAFGGKPDYKNGFFIWGGFKNKTSGDPGTVFQPDLDDKNRETHHLVSAGYNYRLGAKNNILLNFDYNYLKARFYNADPLGSTGVANPALSFINRFGFEQARGFFEKGIYDIGMWNDIQFYAADSTGALLLEGLPPLSFPLSAILDTNTVRSRTSVAENMGYQFKHLVTISDNHDFSYGLEYVPINMMKVKQILSVSQTGAYIGFYDEVFPPGPFYAMGELVYGDAQDEWRFDSSNLIAYINDRWSVSDSLIVEAGIAYEKFKSTNSINNVAFNYDSLHPRVGLSWKLDNIHTVRAAFQKKLYPGTMLSLAPLSTAGLIFDWVQLIPGSTITDYQAAFESRWSNRFFTSFNVEKRDVRDSQNVFGEKNRTYFVSAAANAILSDRLGAFIRYKFADSENKDGLYIGKALPFLPRHAAGAGLVWVSPKYLKVMLSTYYIAGQYGDSENIYKLPDFWTTDFALTWETLKKHLMIKFEAKNIFDAKYETKQGYPAAGRSAFVTMEYRF